MFDFATRLTEMRKRAGLSVCQLSDRSGISKQYLYNLEDGKYVPSLETLEKLSRAFNCTVGQMLDGSTEPDCDRLKRMRVNVHVSGPDESFTVDVLAWNPVDAAHQVKIYLGRLRGFSLRVEEVD